MKSADKLVSRAKKYLKKNQNSEAYKLFEEVLEIFPQNSAALKGLRQLQGRPGQESNTESEPSGEAVKQLFDLTAGKKSAEGLIKANALLLNYPKSALLHNYCGIAYINVGNYKQAIESYNKAINIKPDFVQAQNNLGICYTKLNQPDEAIALFNKAIATRPNFSPSYTNRGVALSHKGDTSAALKSYMKAIEVEPENAETYKNLSKIRTFLPEDPLITKMLELLSRVSLADTSRMQLSYALGKAYEDTKDFRASFQHYSEGNRLRNETLKYNLNTDLSALRVIRKTFSDGVAPVNHLTPGFKETHKLPIFIVGMPRSGTSLVEQIISSHSKVYGAGELNLFTRSVGDVGWTSPGLTTEQLGTIRERYLEGISNISECDYITDKLPENFRWVGPILAAMPEAKIVHVRRDARACCWSVFKHYFPADGNSFANNLNDVVMRYKLYVQMMDFWKSVYPEQVFELSYEALTRNQEEETRNLIDYLGLDWQDDCLHFHKNKRSVKTASSDQIRKKMYQNSSQDWLNYETYLAPYFAALDGL
jgi:tetratricopeptide (TPR) repeat protein